MTPADLANTIADAREGAQHLGGEGWKARKVLFGMGFTTLAITDEGIVAGIRAAERYLSMWQALEGVTRVAEKWAFNTPWPDDDPDWKDGGNSKIVAARQALAQARRNYRRR